MRAVDHENQYEDPIADYLPQDGTVTVFSAPWCPFCTELKEQLVESRIEFREVLIEEDPKAEQLASDANGGDWIIPTVLFSDGSLSVNPGLDGVTKRLSEISPQ